MSIHACRARQQSDQMVCAHCGLVWDMNDPEPPKCYLAQRFPVLGAPDGCPTSVPLAALSEQHAKKVHGQSLARLSQRGGLTAREIYCNVKRKPWFAGDTLSLEDAVELVKALSAQ